MEPILPPWAILALIPPAALLCALLVGVPAALLVLFLFNCTERVCGSMRSHQWHRPRFLRLSDLLPLHLPGVPRRKDAA